MVEHAAQRITDAGVLNSLVDCFRDGNTQRSWMIGILGQQLSTILGHRRGTGMHFAAPDFHHGASVRFGAIRGGDLPHFTFEPKLPTGKGKGAAPLAGACFGREFANAFLSVVPNLRHCGVGLVRPSRAYALIFIVYTRRCIEQFLQSMRPKQGAGPPQAVNVQHVTGYVDVTLGRHLLLNEGLRE